MLIALLCLMVFSTILSTVAFGGLPRLFGRPPLRLEIGIGPSVYKFTTGETEVRVAAFPLLGAQARWQEGEERETPPNWVGRLLIALLQVGGYLLLAVALGGTEVLGHISSGFGHLLSVAWPFGETGVGLVERFSSVCSDAGVATGISILAAKMVALTTILSASSSFFWVGHTTNRLLLTIGMISIFVQLAFYLGIAANVVRSLL